MTPCSRYSVNKGHFSMKYCKLTLYHTIYACTQSSSKVGTMVCWGSGCPSTCLLCWLAFQLQASLACFAPSACSAALCSRLCSCRLSQIVMAHKAQLHCRLCIALSPDPASVKSHALSVRITPPNHLIHLFPSKFIYFQHEARSSEHLEWVNHSAWVLS